jgi:sugar lactone lactonase YvrE
LTLIFEALEDTIGELSESPVWDGGLNALLWCDIPAGLIHELQFGTGRRRRWQFNGPVGSFGLCTDDRLVVACRHDILLLDRDSDRRALLARVGSGDPRTRLNDGKVGPDGAFWVGTMDDTPAKAPIGALYRVTSSGQGECVAEEIITSNGLAWSADARTMFHSDSRRRVLYAWDFDAVTGQIRNRRLVSELTDAIGRPDGGATDAAGWYWSAGVTAGQLNRFDVLGARDTPLPFPVPAPTMPCFGGPDLRTLFVTSLRMGLSDEALEKAPLSGAIFRAQVETPGVAVARFVV